MRGSGTGGPVRQRSAKACSAKAYNTVHAKKIEEGKAGVEPRKHTAAERKQG